MSNIYLKIKQHWKQIAKYMILMGMSLLNLRIMYSGLLNIHEAKKGNFVKLIEEDAPEWYYRSTELLILHDQIFLSIFLVGLIFSLIYHKRTILSFILQVLPFFITVLYGEIYKLLIL